MLAFCCFLSAQAQMEITNTSECDFLVEIVKLNSAEAVIASTTVEIDQNETFTGFYAEGHTGIQITEISPQASAASGWYYYNEFPCCRPQEVSNISLPVNYGSCPVELVYTGYGTLEIR